MHQLIWLIRIVDILTRKPQFKVGGSPAALGLRIKHYSWPVSEKGWKYLYAFTQVLYLSTTLRYLYFP